MLSASNNEEEKIRYFLLGSLEEMDYSESAECEGLVMKLMN